MASFKRQNTRGFKQQSLTNRRTGLVLPCLSPDAEGGRRWQLLVWDWWSDVESRPRQLQLQLQLQAEIVPRTSEWSIMVWKAADCRRAARPCMNCLTSLGGRDPAMEFQFLLKSYVRTIYFYLRENPSKRGFLRLVFLNFKDRSIEISVSRTVGDSL